MNTRLLAGFRWFVLAGLGIIVVGCGPKHRLQMTYHHGEVDAYGREGDNGTESDLIRLVVGTAGGVTFRVTYDGETLDDVVTITPTVDPETPYEMLPTNRPSQFVFIGRKVGNSAFYAHADSLPEAALVYINVVGQSDPLPEK